jgi:hypothetical protein
MRSIWILAAASLPLFTAGCAKVSLESVAAAATLIPQGTPKPGPVGCTLKGDRTCEPGKVPKITVTLTNQTNADIYLVGSLDASDCKWRYPHCYFEVTGPDGKSAVQGIARCGNKNTLRIKDFAKVPPRGTFDPYQQIDEPGFFPAHQLSAGTFRTPGVYRLRFVYSTKSDDIGAWAGDGGRALAANEEIMNLFKQVPRVEVRSNEIVLTVAAPSKE